MSTFFLCPYRLCSLRLMQNCVKITNSKRCLSPATVMRTEDVIYVSKTHGCQYAASGGVLNSDFAINTRRPECLCHIVLRIACYKGIRETHNVLCSFSFSLVMAALYEMYTVFFSTRSVGIKTFRSRNVRHLCCCWNQTLVLRIFLRWNSLEFREAFFLVL